MSHTYNLRSRQVSPVANLKFRAECPSDIGTFTMRTKSYLKSCEYTDLEASFTISSKNLTTLLKIMKGIPDGHVMLQSLNFEDEYNGLRDNSLAGLFGF